MPSVFDVNTEKFIKNLATALKEKMKKPEWASYVKTGVGRERLPDDPDWWYYRAASMLKKVFEHGPVGVSKLRSYYGNLHRRGHKPAKFAKGGGKILRNILQDLEKMNFVGKSEKPKGRIIMPEGVQFMIKIAKASK